MAYATISSFPPLSQISSLPFHADKVEFTVFLEWDKSRPDFPYEVILCYTEALGARHTSQWQTLPLQRSPALPVSIRPKKHDSWRAAYTGSLMKADLVSSNTTPAQHILFTFKYRVNSFAPWLWEQIQSGAIHGELLLLPTSTEHLDIHHALKLETSWTADSVFNDGHTNLYSLQTSHNILRASLDNAKVEDCLLGRIPNLVRFFSIVRLEPYWLGPRHGTDYFHIGEDAILCSFLVGSGAVVTMLAFNGADDVYTVLRSGENGQIVVSSRNDSSVDTPFKILAAVSDKFEDAIAAVMKEAQKLVNNSPQIKDLVQKTREHSTQQVAPIDEWCDGLAYCTWNGLGQDLTTSKLVNGLQMLVESGITVSSLLIDDNWQTLGKTKYDYSDPFFRGWADLEANSDISHNGMKGLITQIREQHPYLQDIGVWHALFGYWGGIANDSKLARAYKTIEVDAKLMGNTPAEVRIFDASEVGRLYDDFYTFLKDSGLTFVKTDVQHMLGELVNTKDRRVVPAAYQSAWTAAHLKHFQGKAISCMSQIPQNMFHSLLQNTTPRIVFRNSDDFYPEVAASHPWHIWVNAHNTLFTQYLNVIPDWDMFQTDHPFSRFHAAARCISGGPIFITDVPGEHDLKLIDEMVAPDPGGRSIALRPGIATSVNVWNNYTDGNVLKVSSSSRVAGNETAYLGLFNVSEKENNFLLCLDDFHGIKSEQVLLRSHLIEAVYGPFTRKGFHDVACLAHLSIPSYGWDLLAVHPVHLIGDVSFAVLGLLGKMTGAAAVTSLDIRDSTSFQLTLKALGSLGIWMSRDCDAKVKMTGNEVSAKHINKSSTDSQGSILEINVLSACKEGDFFDKGYKDVQIEVLFP